jgi:hypothetical protein
MHSAPLGPWAGLHWTPAAVGGAGRGHTALHCTALHCTALGSWSESCRHAVIHRQGGAWNRSPGQLWWLQCSAVCSVHSVQCTHAGGTTEGRSFSAWNSSSTPRSCTALVAHHRRPVLNSHLVTASQLMAFGCFQGFYRAHTLCPVS